jgi:hypothetical protein
MLPRHPPELLGDTGDTIHCPVHSCQHHQLRTSSPSVLLLLSPPIYPAYPFCAWWRAPRVLHMCQASRVPTCCWLLLVAPLMDAASLNCIASCQGACQRCWLAAA